MCKKNRFSRLLDKFLRTERRKYNQRKKYCAKTYPDWRDDEFNCLDQKFIWGLPAKGFNGPASFSTLNDAVVYYNRATEMYYFDCDLSMFDCGDPDSAQHMIEYLERVQDAFAAWYYESNLDKPIDEAYCYILSNGICAETFPMLKLQIDAMICGLQAVLRMKYNLTK